MGGAQALHRNLARLEQQVAAFRRRDRIGRGRGTLGLVAIIVLLCVCTPIVVGLYADVQHSRRLNHNAAIAAVEDPESVNRTSALGQLYVIAEDSILAIEHAARDQDRDIAAFATDLLTRLELERRRVRMKRRKLLVRGREHRSPRPWITALDVGRRPRFEDSLHTPRGKTGLVGRGQSCSYLSGRVQEVAFGNGRKESHALEEDEGSIACWVLGVGGRCRGHADRGHYLFHVHEPADRWEGRVVPRNHRGRPMGDKPGAGLGWHGTRAERRSVGRR